MRGAGADRQPRAACLRFGQSDCTDLRVSEGDPWHRVVPRGWAVLAQDRSHGDAGLVHRDVGERSLAGDVTHCPQPVVDLLVLVGLQPPSGRIGTDRVQAQVGEVGPPPGGNEQLLGVQLLLLEADREPLTVVGDGRGCGADPDGEALAGQDIGHQPSRLGLFEGQQSLRGFNDRNSSAESGEGLSQLDADRSTPQHDQGSRRLLRLYRLAVRPVGGVDEVRDRWDARGGPGSHDDAKPNGVLLPVDSNRVGATDAGGAPDEPAALGQETVHGDGVVPVVCGLLSDALRYRVVVRTDAGLAGHAVNAPRLGQQVGRPDHHLARHAPPVRALPADQLPLHAQNAQPCLSQLPGDLFTTGAEPDDHDIYLLSHAGPPDSRCRLGNPPRAVGPSRWAGCSVGIAASCAGSPAAPIDECP